MAYTKLGRIRPVYKGTWSSSTAYTALEMVSNASGDKAYIAVKDVPKGTALTDTSSWSVVLDVEEIVENVVAATKEAVDVVEAVSFRFHSKNYLSPDDAYGGVLPTGEITAATDRKYTAKIPVTPGKYLMFTYTNASNERAKATNMRYICYFDAENNVLSNAGINTTSAYALIPDGAAYAIATYLTTNSAYFTKAMISEEEDYQDNPPYVECRDARYVNCEFLTPEMFGCVGDGIADDTASLQSAIDYCSKHKIELRSSKQRKYRISQVQITKPFCFDGGGCTIINKEQKSTVLVNRDKVLDEYDNTRINGYLRNIVFDGALIGVGLIYVQNDIRGIYENLIFRNLGKKTSSTAREDEDSGVENLSIALVYSGGGGCSFRSLLGEMQPNYGAYDTLLIDVRGFDSVFSDIDYQHYKFGIRITGACFLRNFHGYITSTEIYEGSYCMRVGKSGWVIASDYYPDTQHYGTIVNNKGRPVIITNGLLYFSDTSPIGTSEALMTSMPPYVIFAPDGDSTQLAGVKLTGCYLNTGAALNGKYKLCNADADIPMVNCITRNVTL